MKRFAVLASFFLLSVSLSAVSVLAETPVERHGRLAVVGNRLVNERGAPVQLRGMSFFWSMAGEGRDYYNADVVNWLVDDWKVSVVRAAMGVDENWGSGSTGYLAGDKSGTVSNKQRVFDVVDAAVAKGIYVIIDWHSHNEGNTEQAKEFFQEMAAKYKDIPNVLYEIFNEPKNGGTGVTNATFWADKVKPYAQTVVDAIRAIDPKNVIIVGTPEWCADVSVATENPVDGDNLVYTVHFYSAYTYHKESLRKKVRTSLDTHNKSVFVSEFGVCMNTGKTPLDTAEATTWLNFLDSNKVSWVNWSISYKDEGASALKPTVKKFDGNWTADDLTVSGAYIREKLIAAAQKEDEEWSTAAQETERVIPNSKTTEAAAVTPIKITASVFSAGPIPTGKASSVKFFWQGKAVKGGSIQIYDAVGNGVKSIAIKNIPATDSPKQTIGAWDLTDAKNRRVPAGSYLLKGKLIKQDGSVVPISSIIVIN